MKNNFSSLTWNNDWESVQLILGVVHSSSLCICWTMKVDDEALESLIALAGMYEKGKGMQVQVNTNWTAGHQRQELQSL